jgi:hypothetical protein
VTRAVVFALCAVLFASGLLGRASTARADAPQCTEAPTDSEVRRRLEVLSNHVRHEEPPIRRWWTSFALLHLTMASSSAILAASAEDEGFRNEMLVGLTGSVLAVTTLLIFSPALLGAGDTLRGLPDTTPEERLYKMRIAENILHRSASTVDLLHSWFPSTLTTLYVTAASGVLLLAFERTTGAYTHMIGGSILGLGRVLLHPTGSRDAWRRYFRAHPDADCEEITAPSPGASWQLTPYGIGAGLRVTF